MKHFFITVYTIIILTGCGSDKPECSETQPYEIVPSEGIGPYVLGMTEEELISILCDGYVKKEEKALFSSKATTYYFLKNMSFICRKGRLQEINVWGSFKGSFEDIDVNYDKEYLEKYGDVIVHDGEYRILDVPNIAFGKENSDEGKYIKIYR